MGNQNAAIQNLRSKVARQNGLLREARAYIERLQVAREKARCPDRLHFGGGEGGSRQQQQQQQLMRSEIINQQRQSIPGPAQHPNPFDRSNAETVRHHNYQNQQQRQRRRQPQQQQQQQNWSNQCLPPPQRQPVAQPSAVYSRASSISQQANPLRSPLLSTSRRSLYSPLFLPPQPAHFR
ncbi:hypothetical protein H4R20_002171 [Coemansia guatemalensis]|uniref:Uncharacterized protein n=1 Tax=Coemansia guatemalensis TaxID=2761395 RepID=A0A9W8HVN1_9FUNG|nr:hypothetical protein H4R20_002171 [Coemansia guatemalensis]